MDREINWKLNIVWIEPRWVFITSSNFFLVIIRKNQSQNYTSPARPYPWLHRGHITTGSGLGLISGCRTVGNSGPTQHVRSRLGWRILTEEQPQCSPGPAPQSAGVTPSPPTWTPKLHLHNLPQGTLGGGARKDSEQHVLKVQKSSIVSIIRGKEKELQNTFERQIISLLSLIDFRSLGISHGAPQTFHAKGQFLISNLTLTKTLMTKQ